MTSILHQGDCREVMRGLAEASVDAIVCDPPYGLEFMGKEWDRFRSDDRNVAGYNGRESGAQGEATTAVTTSDHAARRNRAVAYGGGARATTSRCEGCGKRDQFRKPHACPSGTNWRSELVDPFSAPPSMLAFENWTREWAIEAYRILKPGGHLAAFGGTRTYHRLAAGVEDAGFEIRDQLAWVYGSGFPKSHNGEWGGTALKPAWEPIVLARKPLIGTVEENWKTHGTGALNIDGCRIDWQGQDESALRKAAGYSDAAKKALGKVVASESASGFSGEVVGTDSAKGRWPANILHDGSDEVVAQFPSEAGAAAPVTVRNDDKFRNGDSGSAARFFYCAKAASEDREEGLSGTPRLFGMSGAAAAAAARGEHYDNGDGGVNRTTLRRNIHPTVKPTDLMRWLCRLITPKGGLILDPFVGSGSTGKAAMLEGFRFVGIDLSPEYIEIARARIDFARRQGHQPSLPLEAA